MIRRLFLAAALLLACTFAQAQTLTTAQLAVMKADILADGTLNAFPNTGDGNSAIADLYNAQAAPTFTVWKSNVSIVATGQAYDGAEWAGMTTANHTRLQTVAQWLPGGYNASTASVRAMFNDIWSGAGGTVTRASLLVLWKRTSTRVEKLFATGTGSDAVPATLVWEGRISYQEVQRARNS